MRMLAEENLENEIVTWLRQEGHDVIWVTEAMPATDDPVLLDAAASQGRVLITHDLDFGEHVFRHLQQTAGVLLLRFDNTPKGSRLALFLKYWPTIESKIQGNYVVMSTTHVRVRPLPERDAS